WPGVHIPGQLGPIRRAPCSRTTIMARVISITGMPSVIQTIRLILALAASIIASAAPAGGTKIQLASASVAAFASATVSKTGTPSAVVPPLPGVTPPTIFVPAVFILRVCYRPSRPVMPCIITRVELSNRILMLFVSLYSFNQPRRRFFEPPGAYLHPSQAQRLSTKLFPLPHRCLTSERRWAYLQEVQPVP